MAPPQPPIPVPSKAAIRALRGLVLGTTCSLALVAEDRRRRINAARSAIRNGDRIRSARRYHAGGSALAITLEEESLSVEPGVIHWDPQPQPRRNTTDWRDAAPLHRSSRGTSRTADTSSREGPHVHAPPAPSAETAPLVAAAETRSPPPDADARSSPGFAFPPFASAAAEHMQRSVASLAQQAQSYQSRAQLGRRRHHGPGQAAAAAAAAKTVEQHDVYTAARPPVNVPAVAESIRTLAASRHAGDLESGVQMLLLAVSDTSDASDAPVASDASAAPRSGLWSASAALCRVCTACGRVDLAQTVLRVAVASGELDGAAYFAHNPLPVVQTLTPLDEARAAVAEASPSLTPAEAAGRRDGFVRRLQDAVSLFLPARAAASVAAPAAADLVAVGRPLLECAFAARHQPSIRSVYASLTACPGDLSAFVVWYLGQLHAIGAHRALVAAFLARPPAADALSTPAYLELGDRIVEAARLGCWQRADAILTALAAARPADARLRTAWVTDLLYGHWQHTKRYDETEVLFRSLSQARGATTATTATTLADVVYYIDGAYRVMVQVALEADREEAARALFGELSVAQPAAAGDVRLLGLFALAKARRGDWAGVEDDFATAARAAGPDGLPARDAERVFVPIVKAYLQTHTIGETEDFVRHYIDRWRVPVGRQMVTLLANEYGALREVRSFVGWLEYCARAGFAVDAAFSNAILLSCRRHWKFGFRDLRTLYRKLRLLSPNFEDKVTQTIMMHAAVSDAKHGGRAVKGRVLSLRIATPATGAKPPGSYLLPPSAVAADRAPLQHHLHYYADANDLYVAMKQAFASGHPAKVVRLYKHAMRGGLPPSAKCLKLAVAAAIRGERQKPQKLPKPHQPHHQPQAPRSSQPSKPSQPSQSSTDPTCSLAQIASAASGNGDGPGGFDTAIELLRTAHAAGEDIDGAAAYLAIAYIDALGARTPGGGKTSVATAVKTILCRLQMCDVQISDLALNRAAFHMFKAGHMRGAIALALAAAHSPVGGGRPGYNVWNFSVLVSSFARLADAHGIRTATEGAAAAGVLAELMGYKVLKQARRRLHVAALEEGEGAGQVLRRAPGQNLGQNPGPASGQEARAAHVARALRAVEAAIEQARAARQKLADERRKLETATVDIMRRAALDAGREPVDFDTVPFLRRQPLASPAHAGADAAEARAGAGSGEEDAYSRIGSGSSSGSGWDMLAMPVDADGCLVGREALPAVPTAA